MKLTFRYITFILLLLNSILTTVAREKKVSIQSSGMTICWELSNNGWAMHEFKAFGKNMQISDSSDYILYSAEKPATDAVNPSLYDSDGGFPESEYRYVIPSWQQATNAVSLNMAGDKISYSPQTLTKISKNSLELCYSSPQFTIVQLWSITDEYFDVVIKLTPNKPGWYSIQSPTIFVVPENELQFAIIPGVLHGHNIGSDFVHDYAYGWDIPNKPVIFRERCVSSQTSIISDKKGLTMSVTALPGTAAEPWGYDKRNTEWRLGLSAMNRDSDLTPTLYHPVLGEAGSYLSAGESTEFHIRYAVCKDDWWQAFNNVVYKTFNFENQLKYRKNRQSLSSRLAKIHKYVVNDSTSKWHTVNCDSIIIGAQEYLGGVYKANKDAMKNADYGAMWMMGALTNDSLITAKRLPYARNFKLLQHNFEDGSFKGASKGQYYLCKTNQFVEEWGPYTEPIATSYYMTMDLGNILLFNPEDYELKQLLRASADCLINLQKEDGSWAVAFADDTKQEIFTDLKDYRPTFYGLLVAYKILGDDKYLKNAKRGADWLIKNAVENHRWLGVCGDTRFAPDFATAQAAQAFLDLYDLCAEQKYLDAAIATARFYTTSVYTAPEACERDLLVGKNQRKQWEITMSGLSYEHGGIIGSCNLHGPILLASHAGMFVRMYKITGDRIFLDMARSAAIGRDAFVDDATGIASYYWAAMNRGAGPYPHHAWWQAGWIMDYLISEIELRSQGKISFPAGFITPKVGPHRSYGFAPGNIYGKTANLMWPGEGISIDNPNVEAVCAKDDNRLYVILLNDLGSTEESNIIVDKNLVGSQEDKVLKMTLKPYGIEVVDFELK